MIYEKKCLALTAGVGEWRKKQVFSRGSRVFVGEFKTKLGQNWVKKCGMAREVLWNREKCKYLSTFVG